MFNLTTRMLTRPNTFLAVRPLLCTPTRLYYKNNVLMPREHGEYYADPVGVSERLVRMFALHDNVQDPSGITLKSNFTEMGLNALDMCEIFLAVEREFDLEISEEDCEVMHTV